MTARKKRPSAADYLADLDAPKAEEPKPSKRAPDKAKAPDGDKKSRITVYFRRSLLEEARSAVLQLGFQGKQPSTLSTLFDAALERELVRLRKAHNEGEPFEPYKAPLPGGRPRRQ
jgi:hypothetical protein